MATTIEHYSKFINYVIDVEFDDVLYNVYIGTPLGETDSIDTIVNAETAEDIGPEDPLYSAILAAAKAEVSTRETLDVEQVFAQIQKLSDPLVVRDAEELLDAITAINELVKNR